MNGTLLPPSQTRDYANYKFLSEASGVLHPKLTKKLRPIFDSIHKAGAEISGRHFARFDILYMIL
jgi:hypothetical protein